MTGAAPDCPARQCDTAGFELGADFKLHRKRGQLSTLMRGARIHPPSPPSQVALDCPYLNPGNHFLSGPARKERTGQRVAPNCPVCRPPVAPAHWCLPGLQLQRALLSRHQEGVWELSVNQLPHLPVEEGASGIRPYAGKNSPCSHPALQAGTALTQAGAQAPDSTQTEALGILSAASRLTWCEVEGQFQRVTRNRNWTSK